MKLQTQRKLNFWLTVLGAFAIGGLIGAYLFPLIFSVATGVTLIMLHVLGALLMGAAVVALSLWILKKVSPDTYIEFNKKLDQSIQSLSKQGSENEVNKDQEKKLGATLIAETLSMLVKQTAQAGGVDQPLSVPDKEDKTPAETIIPPISLSKTDGIEAEYKSTEQSGSRRNSRDLSPRNVSKFDTLKKFSENRTTVNKDIPGNLAQPISSPRHSTISQPMNPAMLSELKGRLTPHN